MPKRTLQSTEADLRSWVDEQSEFRRVPLKHKQTPRLSPSEEAHRARKIIVTNTRLWRRFKAAGGSTL